jgi:2-dehydro-3-deoxygluconokinase
MGLKIRPKQECRWDLVSLGEVMLRFDPGNGRIATTRHFDVYEGGGEYNVARGLKRCFGLNTSIVTALADDPVGKLIQDFIFQAGVDQSLIRWVEHDGVGRSVRNGLNFTERGYGVRAALGSYDRGHTAISQLKPGDIDWDEIFGKQGVRWFHTGGIFCALGKKQAQEVNRRIAPHVNVMIGNEEDFSAALGYEIPGVDANFSKLEVDAFKQMIAQVVKDYPFDVVATTLRKAKTATKNDWGAICYCDGQFYQAKDREDLEIFDRVGGGDSFASGLIYGFLAGEGPQWAVECGAAHGALAMTTPGDTSMASLKEVIQIMKGVGARIAR